MVCVVPSVACALCWNSCAMIFGIGGNLGVHVHEMVMGGYGVCLCVSSVTYCCLCCVGSLGHGCFFVCV